MILRCWILMWDVPIKGFLKKTHLAICPSTVGWCFCKTHFRADGGARAKSAHRGSGLGFGVAPSSPNGEWVVGFRLTS